MKKSFRIISVLISATVFIILCSFCFGKKQKPVVKIDALKMNVFYSGVENPVSLSVWGIDPDDLLVSMKGGSIRKDSLIPSRYYVLPENEYDYVYINIQRKSGKGNLIAIDTFRVKPIQNPVTTFGNIRNDGMMSKEEIRGEAGIFSRMFDCDFDGRFRIESFKMSVYSNGVWKETVCKGPSFTREMKYDLSKVESTDKIIFSDVMVEGVDGFLGAKPRKINSLVITVK